MGPGGIATIIAASSLAVIALAIAYLIIRAGKFIDQASVTLNNLTDEVAPLLDEINTTFTLINGPLASINKVSKNVENLTTKITETTEGFLDNKIAAKAVGAILSAAKIKKATSKGRKKKSAEEQE
jgi:uncharacterized protein YoxC